ncbi:MAG: hypothetical protein ACYCZ0_01625 [Minisyncoccota bacterium]
MDETEQNGYIRNADGTFTKGTAPGPGRPVDTPEKVIEKKAIKQLVEEYKQALAEDLPEIKPVLKQKALDGDVPAIKEIHNRVMGMAQQNIDVLSGGEKISFNVVSYKDHGDTDSISLRTQTIPTPAP